MNQELGGRVRVAQSIVLVCQGDAGRGATVDEFSRASAQIARRPLHRAKSCGLTGIETQAETLELVLQEPKIEASVVRNEGSAANRLEQGGRYVGECGCIQHIASVYAVNMGGTDVTLGIDEGRPLALDRSVVADEDHSDLYDAVMLLRKQPCRL
jgi:hypothetical protein